MSDNERVYMDPTLERLIKNLPDSSTKLSQKNVRKIQRYLPVPSDYDILWADILNFGGYPAGVVLTKQALVVKASKDEVKANAKAIKADNVTKGRNEKTKPPKTMYRIIPWEYYSPEDYVVIEVGNGPKKHYVLKTGDSEIARFASSDLCKLLNGYRDDFIRRRNAAEEVLKNSSFSAINAVNSEAVMFNAAYGSDQTKTGHGIYAEEAGALLDVLHGEQSSVVGRDNAKNGPDKIVNAAPVQCKYCKTANASVDACFNANSSGQKTFRYLDLSGKPMKVEVPSDQYAAAIDRMKSKISSGQVPGVSDPEAAYDIIRKGRLSYSQALNLAKAGTVESITYDAATGAIGCLSAFGISSIVAFAQVLWKTKDPKAAAKTALWTGLKVYGLSFAGSILASQISRTGAANALQPVAVSLSQNLDKQFVQGFINAFRALAGKKAIYGTAAQKSFVKFLGSNALAECVMFVVFAVPDTFDVVSRKMSGAQYVKNMLSLLASFGGSIGGTAVAGGVIGKKIGGSINKSAGKAIGLGVGMAVGGIAGATTKAVGNVFKEDDCIITTRMFNAVLVNSLFDYMLSAEEQDKLFEALAEDNKALSKLQKQLINSNSQERDILDYLEPKIKKAISSRKTISRTDEQLLEQNISEVIVEGGLDDEM